MIQKLDIVISELIEDRKYLISPNTGMVAFILSKIHDNPKIKENLTECLNEELEKQEQKKEEYDLLIYKLIKTKNELSG